MNINDWSNRELIKLILAKDAVTQKKLANNLCEKLGKEFAPSTLSSKIARNSLKVEELQAICEILGYDLILEKR